jgi:hypothetical protein
MPSFNMNSTLPLEATLASVYPRGGPALADLVLIRQRVSQLPNHDYNQQREEVDHPY